MVKNLTTEVENILKNANIEEYKAEAKIIILEVSKMSLEELIVNNEVQNKKEIISIAKKRAETKMPLQHILGYSYFMGKKYIVNENVLIPRDETEILVKKAYELLKNKKDKINILDIGTGSGCISCALGMLLNDYDVEILGIDISSDALITALENVNLHNLVKKVVLRKSDLYSNIRSTEKFDLIISNPPYIPVKNKKDIQKEVVDFEPHEALFANDEQGIEFYKKIIEKAPNYLKKDGHIIFEIGIGQRQLIENLLQKNFFDINCELDMANIERVLYAKLK